MFVVDTNVLLYAADLDSPDHDKCASLVAQWRKQDIPWYLTWGIVYEFARVVTHPKVFRRPWPMTEAGRFLQTLLNSPSIGILLETDRHMSVAAEVFLELPGISGNLVFDAHTAILMIEHGIRRIYTRDAGFNRFPFVDVIDPLSGRGRTTIRERRRARLGAT